MLTPPSLKSPRRFFTAGLTVIVSVVATLALAGSSSALALNEVQLDNGVCGQVLNNGAVPTLSRSRTPSFLLAGDGGLASYSIFIDGAPLGTFRSDGFGNVCIYTTVPLSDGPHQLTGNELAPHSTYTVIPFNFSVDATPPASPSTPVLNPLTDSGLKGDNITNANYPRFTGTAEPGITMQVFAGPSVMGGSTADGNGNWAVTTMTLPEGTHSMTAAAFDTAGNKSALSAPLLLTIDTTPPPVPPLPALDPASDSGIIGDNVTSVVTPTLTGTVSTDTREVTVYSDGIQAGPPGIRDAAGAWRVTLPTQTLGVHQITLKATDVAGNVSPLSSASSLTIVSGSSPSAPGAPTLNSATAGNSFVSLGWSAPASDGGSPITGYKIYRGTTSGGETLLTTVGTGTNWTDTNVGNGITYFYQVSATNFVGEGIRSAERFATPAAAATVPGAPTLTSATPGSGIVSLAWTAPASNGGSAITGYKIYRGTWSGGETLLTTVGVLSGWTDFNAANGTTYYYQVSATNAVGEGSRSNERSAMPVAPAGIPGAPTLNSASPGNGTVALAWNAPASDGGSPITGYKIYRGTTSGGETLLATVGVLTGWTDTNAANGVTYFYQVSATNFVGEGARSNERSATTLAPATPPAAPSLTATAGNAFVSLTWTTPANGGSAITGYKIYRGTSSGGETLLTTLGAATNSWTDFSVTNGITYYYQVSATNAVGEGSRFNERSATPTASATVPGTPTLNPATAGNGTVSLNWTAPANGGSPINAYLIYRGTSSGGEVFYGTVVGTSWTDTGVTNGTTYYYQVAASNAVGAGSRSNERSATPTASATAPGAPDLTAATAGNGTVALTWTTPANGGSAITGYKIYRGTWSGGETLLTTVGVLSGWTDFNAANGTTYYYQVSATNSVGEGGRSNERSATPAAAATVPGAPTLTSATPGSGIVSLAWTAPASNGGSAITGYKIYRGTWSGGETLLTTVGVLSGWTDFNAANGTTYYYQVSATNSVGEGGRSNERSATPAAAATVPGAPTLTSATAGSGIVSLAWTAPASNGGSAITGYKIYRGTWSGGETLLTTVGVLSGWTDFNAANGTTYYYQVSATNSVGEGGRSNERFATPVAAATVPGAPTLTSATPGSGIVSLAWTAPASNGGSAITGYKIYRGTWSGGETLLTTVGVLSGWTDFNAANGTTYYYQVSATNSVGEGGRSGERFATPVAAATVPGAPTLTSATPGSGIVSLAWTAPASNGGSAITGYKIYRGTWSGGETLLTTVGVLSGWTDFNAANGTTYYYQVSATNSVGEGGRSNERSATPAVPDTTPPSKPASLKTVLEGTTQIIVDWPAATDNVAVTGYKVYRNSVFVALVQTTWFNDSGLTPGATYSYFVKAVDAAGNESQQSSSDSMRTVSLSTGTTGTMSGVVFNGAGTPIANVVASFMLPNGTPKSTKSNNTGEWKFSNLPPGTYAVSFARTGSPTTTLTLTVQAGRTTLTAVVTTP